MAQYALLQVRVHAWHGCMICVVSSESTLRIKTMMDPSYFQNALELLPPAL